jgi:hypothetical protein
MWNELFLLRALSPGGFRAIRWIGALLFWGFLAVWLLGLIAEMISPHRKPVPSTVQKKSSVMHGRGETK